MPASANICRNSCSVQAFPDPSSIDLCVLLRYLSDALERGAPCGIFRYLGIILVQNLNLDTGQGCTGVYFLDTPVFDHDKDSLI